MKLERILKAVENENYDKADYDNNKVVVIFKEKGKMEIESMETENGQHYKIKLFVPSEEDYVESWNTENHNWNFHEHISKVFWNLYTKLSINKMDSYCKYFPGQD